jgi:hypothetical protein
MIGSTLNMKRTTICSVALAALALTVSFASQSLAQNTWTLRLSEKEGELANGSDPMWSKWLMWDIGYQRMVERNSPYLEVTNASTSTLPITQFHITIGDNRFNFAPVVGTDLVALGSTTPGVALTSSTVGGLGDELVVNIGGGGLAPGQMVRFKIKLGIDPSFAADYANSFGSSLPDYRTVLFDMNGVNVYGSDGKPNPEDNSHAHVVFDTNVQSGTSIFPDATVPGPVYFNNIIRSYSAIDMVNLFELNGSQQVPEPTSIGLVLLGIAGFSVNARSRSRRSVA